MRRAKYPIGVDIGSHTVKVAQMRRTSSGFELERVGMADIYLNGEQPTDHEEQRQAKINALKRALEDGGIRAKYSCSAVCGESIIVRYLQLPQMPEDELKKALQWEAEEYIPFRLSEVNLDSVILGKVDGGDHPKMDVLLVSAKKDLVNEHVSIIRAAGLEPRVIDVDSFAFLNCFEVNHEPTREDCLALVNIGGEMTSINIYGQGTTRFSRDVPIGGDTMTSAIKARLGCSFSEAERLKLAHGIPLKDNSAGSAQADERSPLVDSLRGSVDTLSKEGKGEDAPEAIAGQAVASILNNLLSEVRRSIEFFESQYRGQNVGRVVLGGGSIMLHNLQEYFSQDLKLPIEIIDPFKRVRVSSRNPKHDQLEQMRHQLGVSIGLGIRGIAA